MEKHSKKLVSLPDQSGTNQADFENGLNRFFSGKPTMSRKDLSVGATAEQIEGRNADLYAALDNLEGLEELPDLSANFVTALDENAPIDRTDNPVRFTPFDKALAGLRTARQRLDVLEVETPEYHLALVELEKAVQKWEAENERAIDPSWRKLRNTDEWRSDAGREEYNASRRKVRGKANADLSKLTEEQKTAHRNTQKRDSEYAKRKEAAGWTLEQVQIGLDKRRAKRNSLANF